MKRFFSVSAFLAVLLCVGSLARALEPIKLADVVYGIKAPGMDFNLCGLIPRSLLRYTGWYEPIYP